VATVPFHPPSRIDSEGHAQPFHLVRRHGLKQMLISDALNCLRYVQPNKFQYQAGSAGEIIRLTAI